MPHPLTPLPLHMPHPSSQEAQKLPEYGNVFYQVAKVCVSDIYVRWLYLVMAEDVPIVFSLQDKRGAEGQVWLGFCVRGIVVYNVHKDVKTPIRHCPWKKTKNISFAVSTSWLER